MGEARRAQFDPIGLIGAVRHEIDAKLPLRRLDGGVDLAGWDLVAFGI